MHCANRNSKLDAIGRTAWIALLINLYFKPHWKWLTCYVKYFAVLFRGSLEYATINTKKISILKRPLISFQVTQSEKCCKIWTMDSCKGEICKNPGKRPWKKNVLRCQTYASSTCPRFVKHLSLFVCSPQPRNDITDSSVRTLHLHPTYTSDLRACRNAGSAHCHLLAFSCGYKAVETPKLGLQQCDYALIWNFGQYIHK